VEGGIKGFTKETLKRGGTGQVFEEILTGLTNPGAANKTKMKLKWKTKPKKNNLPEGRCSISGRCKRG